MSDSLGDRMKFFESIHSPILIKDHPVIARIDGKGFSNFTHGLKRPYDERLTSLMIETTENLVYETNAKCGYTESDEISLVWENKSENPDIFFAGKLQKMISVVASITTAFFNKNLHKIEEKKDQTATFDCRVFQVPNESEAVNCFIWREQDATRNSIQMAARHHFSHAECNKKDCNELKDMLLSINVDWNDYPNFFKHGTYVRKRILKKRMFTDAEIQLLPPKHHARTNPEMTYDRKVIVREDFTSLMNFSNRIGVLLLGEDPILKDNQNDQVA